MPDCFLTTSIKVGPGLRLGIRVRVRFYAVFTHNAFSSKRYHTPYTLPGITTKNPVLLLCQMRFFIHGLPRRLRH